MRVDELVGMPADKQGMTQQTTPTTNTTVAPNQQMGQPENPAAANKQKQEQKKAIQNQIKATREQLKMLQQQLASIR